MLLEDLATELLTQIFLSCGSVTSLVNLASTCHRLHGVYRSSRRLDFICAAAEAQYGPLHDAIQLVTHNASQPAHRVRHAPLSESLLRQVLEVGRVARRWEELYPSKKWKDNFADRRLLTPAERRALRRALYRLWLFARAFHAPAYPRYTRQQRGVVLERAALLQGWRGAELAELADARGVVAAVLRGNVCPSNGAVRRKFRKRFPDSPHQLMFNLHLNYPPPAAAAPRAADGPFRKYLPTALHEPGSEGWGDDTEHYYVIQDMLKLDPGQVLWLKENTSSKAQVEAYVRGFGEWFNNNGDTLGSTLDFVLEQRGVEIQEFRDALEDGLIGVAKGRR